MVLLLSVLVAFSISAFLSWFILPRVLVVTYKKRLFDLPNDRKIHTQAVPRMGGITFFPTILIATTSVIALRYLWGYGMQSNVNAYAILSEVCLLLSGLTLLYLTGVRDDLIGCSYKVKFAIQFLVASFLPLSGLWINNLYGLLGIHVLTPWLGIPLTILLTVFIINSINLIDGIDGLASGLSIVALIVLGSLYIQLGNAIFAILSFATLGQLLPFFYFNVFGRVERRRKIFMGDTGSLTLGYILAFLAIRYVAYDMDFAPYSEGAIAVAFSTLLIPMFDVVRVMLVRARQGKSLFKPDQNHIHHKFLRMGFSPREAMVCLLLMACAFAIANIVLVKYVNNNVLLIGDILSWCFLNLLFDWQVKTMSNTKEPSSVKPLKYGSIANENK